MKSIKEGPFHMGTVSDVITGGTEGAVQQFNKARFKRQIVVQRCTCEDYNANNQENHFIETIQEKWCSWNVGARECPRPKRLQDSDYFKDKMLLMQAQENGAVLDEEQSLFLAGEQVTNFDDDVDDSPENDLALNVDHVFKADECDAIRPDG
ncbi:hypothetical protein Tco_0792925 [Tanacetum coccineum]